MCRSTSSCVTPPRCCLSIQFEFGLMSPPTPPASSGDGPPGHPIVLRGDPGSRVFSLRLIYPGPNGRVTQRHTYQISYKIFDLCLSLFTGFLQADFPRMVPRQKSKVLENDFGWWCGLAGNPSRNRPRSRPAEDPRCLPAGVRSRLHVGFVWLMLTVPLVFINSTCANAAIAAGRLGV